VELLRARKELEETVKKFSDLYDFAPVGYVTLDRTGTILGANLTFSGITGVERSRLIGRRFRMLIAENARANFACFLEQVFSCTATVSGEIMLLKGGHSELNLQLEGVASPSGEECRIALINITGQRQATEALRREAETSLQLRLLKESAEATARTKSQFFANMSHELRTPMTGIIGMIQIALKEELAPETREYLETALGLSRSLLRILNDILEMARFAAGRISIANDPFSPRGCIAEAVDVIKPEAVRKGLDLTVSVAEDIPETLAGDHARLRQILVNLIINAVKFTETGTVEVRVCAGKKISGGKREFTFAVTDTGIGIPDDNKDLLFQAFSQVDASHSRRYGGTGLGLVICREIVELMGGTISHVSRDGGGSTFSFTIPLEAAETEIDAPGACEALPDDTITAPEPGRMPLLLLVEDDPVIRQVLELMLRKSSYNLHIAEDGRKAVEMWEAGEYDVVLMDIQMPYLDGFEATRAIREKERGRGGHTPIVAMTAHALKEDEEKCLDAGMDAYIPKPIDFVKTLHLIRKILDKSTEHDEKPIVHENRFQV